MSNTRVYKSSYIDQEIDIDDVYDFIEEATPDEVQEILDACKENLTMVEEDENEERPRQTLYDVLVIETLQDVGKLYSLEELCQLVKERKKSEVKDRK